jgi:predicted NUDIX family phosphoesterase
VKAELPKKALLDSLSREKLLTIAQEVSEDDALARPIHETIFALSHSRRVAVEFLTSKLDLSEAFSALKALRRLGRDSEGTADQVEDVILQVEARIDALLIARNTDNQQLSLFNEAPSHEGSFLDAAYTVLTLAGRPLTANELVDRASSLGLLHTTGRTPERTMAARLSENLHQEGARSKFMRTMPAVYALREWENRILEYRHPAKTISQFDEDVLVFPADSLSQYIDRPGSLTRSVDWESLVREIRVMRRSEAEQTFSVIQLVSFFVVESGSKFFTYMRGARLPESRLHGEFSIGIGGHLGPEDQAPLFNFLDPRHGEALMLRELFEELEIHWSNIETISFAGALYDNSRPVSRQHLALVYTVTTNTTAIRIAEPGFLHRGRFETIGEVLDHVDDFENWSQIVINFIRAGEQAV